MRRRVGQLLPLVVRPSDHAVFIHDHRPDGYVAVFLSDLGRVNGRPHEPLVVFALMHREIVNSQQRIPPRGAEPLEGNEQVPEIKELTENANSVLSTSLDNLLQIYPELAELVKAWPELPESAKTAIKALVQTREADKSK